VTKCFVVEGRGGEGMEGMEESGMREKNEKEEKEAIGSLAVQDQKVGFHTEESWILPFQGVAKWEECLPHSE